MITVDDHDPRVHPMPGDELYYKGQKFKVKRLTDNGSRVDYETTGDGFSLGSMPLEYWRSDMRSASVTSLFYEKEIARLTARVAELEAQIETELLARGSKPNEGSDE